MRDVAIIIKTAYSTIDRLTAQLDSLGFHGDYSLLVVADFATELTWEIHPVDIDDDLSSRTVKVHDAIKILLETGQVNRENSRIRKYEKLQTAISSGNNDQAEAIGREVGWELDAVKVCCRQSSSTDCLIVPFSWLLTHCLASLCPVSRASTKISPTRIGTSCWMMIP